MMTVLRNLSNQLIKEATKNKIQDHPFTKNQIDTQLQSLKKIVMLKIKIFMSLQEVFQNQTYRSDNYKFS